MISYQPVLNSIWKEGNLKVDVLRLDLIDPKVSGNKWFKLKYNLQLAEELNHKTLLTFGGAHSNHLAATAFAGKKFGFQTIGVVRGKQIKDSSPTLKEAANNGMIIHYLNRIDYSKKNEEELLELLKNQFGDFYLIPEGGNNPQGLRGSSEIIDKTWDYDYILCACGTGATFAGIYLSLKPNQILLGFSVLKGENHLLEEVKFRLKNFTKDKPINIKGNEELENEVILHSCLNNSYAFSGYAKYSPEIFEFKRAFETETNIALDHVYTAKLFYAAKDLITKNKFKTDSKILLIHSGGLQGNAAFEARYQRMLTL